MPSMDHHGLAMPIGEAIFTQRSIRRFRPDPVPVEDLRLIVEAAVRAPNGGNRQIARFLVVTNRARIREFGALYREAWWAKRRDEGHAWKCIDDIPPEEKTHRAAARLADEMKDVPCVVFALAIPPGAPNSVIPAAQNLMLPPGPSASGRCRPRSTQASWTASAPCSGSRRTSPSTSASRSGTPKGRSARTCGGPPRRRRSSTAGAAPCRGRDSGCSPHNGNSLLAERTSKS